MKKFSLITRGGYRKGESEINLMLFLFKNWKWLKWILLVLIVLGVLKISEL